MWRELKKVKVIGLVTLLLIIIIFIIVSINNNNRKSGIEPTSKVNSVYKSPNPQIETGEDEDVYQQRQLRADSNNSSSSPNY